MPPLRRVLVQQLSTAHVARPGCVYHRDDGGLGAAVIIPIWSRVVLEMVNLSALWKRLACQRSEAVDIVAASRQRQANQPLASHSANK